MLALFSVSYANPIGWNQVSGGQAGAGNYPSPSGGGYPDAGRSNSGSGNGGYQGSSGARYEYNLNNPADSLRYGVDPAAQLRDQIAVDPGRTLDRDTGQYGGGYLGR